MATSVTQPAGSGAWSGGSWANTNNISASDDQYTTCVVNASTSVTFFAYNFGFSIPSNATINGISVSVEAKAASTSSLIYLYNVALGTWNGSTFTTKGSAKANNIALTNTDTIYSFGSSTDLWNASWTYSDFNTSQFGCRISFVNNRSVQDTIYVDYVAITITYTTGTTYQLTASIPTLTTFTPNISITKSFQSAIAGSTSFNSVLQRFAGLEALINGNSILSSFANIYKSLISAINGATQISPFIAIQKSLTAAIQSSTSFISDLIIRGKQFLNAVISTGTAFVSNLKVQYALASTFAGKTQVSSFASIKKALQGSAAGQTIFVGTIERIRQLVSNITTQTILTAQLIVPKLLSALISGGTSFVGQIQRLRGLVSQVIGQTTIQAQLISSQLLQAVIGSATHLSAFLKKDIKIFASFVGSTIFVAVPTFWNKVKKPTATWQQKNEEVEIWRRIK